MSNGADFNDIQQAMNHIHDVNDWLSTKLSPRSHSLMSHIIFKWQTLTSKKEEVSSDRLHKAFSQVLQESDSEKLSEVSSLIKKTLVEAANSPQQTKDPAIKSLVADLQRMDNTCEMLLQRDAYNTFILESSDYLGPHLNWNDNDKQFLKDFMKDPRKSQKLNTYLKQCRLCREMNLATLEEPYQLIDLEAPHNLTLYDLDPELTSLLDSGEEIKNLNRILLLLKERALLSNSQIHFDTLTTQLFTPREATEHKDSKLLIDHFSLPDAEPIDFENDVTWPHRELLKVYNLDQDREKRMKEIGDVEDPEFKRLADDMRFVSRMSTDLLQKASWKDVKKEGDQFFVEGLRVISFRTADGHQKDLEVRLDLSSLGHLSRQTTHTVFHFLNTFYSRNNTIRIHYPEILPGLYDKNELSLPIKDLHPEVSEELQKMPLTQDQKDELLKIALKFSYEIDKSLSLNLMNIGF